jgi:hypothetical protein
MVKNSVNGLCITWNVASTYNVLARTKSWSWCCVAKISCCFTEISAMNKSSGIVLRMNVLLRGRLHDLCSWNEGLLFQWLSNCGPHFGCLSRTCWWWTAVCSVLPGKKNTACSLTLLLHFILRLLMLHPPCSIAPSLWHHILVSKGICQMTTTTLIIDLRLRFTRNKYVLL